jgi:hypothetical protein
VEGTEERRRVSPDLVEIVAMNNRNVLEQARLIESLNGRYEHLQNDVDALRAWTAKHDEASCELLTAATTLVAVADDLNTLKKLRKWVLGLVLFAAMLLGLWSQLKDFHSRP